MTNFFKHEQALVESKHVGEGTRIWAYAHVLPGAKIGADCNICDHVFIENEVVVGDGVTIKCGVQLWDGIRVEDGVFIGPNATFTNDIWPRSRHWQESYPRTVIEAGASIGANATILPGLTIGRGAMIGAGAVVTRSVPPYAVVTGNPAKVVRFVTSDDIENIATEGRLARGSLPAQAELIDGVQLESLSMIVEPRGNLIVGELGRGMPFMPKRFFLISKVSSKEVRGQHAHKICHQLLICLNGSVNCLVDNGSERKEYCLDSPELALHIPPMNWGTQYQYSSDAMLMVLASHEYDPEDYIQDYSQFRAMKNLV